MSEEFPIPESQLGPLSPPALPGVMSSAHYEREMLSSGLSAETVLAARIRTVSASDSAQVAGALNWKQPPGAAFGDWLAIPYLGVDGSLTGFVRFKPDRPRKDKTGRPVKYESPVGVSPRLYFPPNQRPEIYTDPTIPLILTEGEKKSLALVQHGFPAVGLAGVWSWMTKRLDEAKPRELIEDFRSFRLDGRRIIILFDSDLATNDKVLWAAFYLGETLKRHGAEVLLAQLPSGVDGQKVGADDALLQGGPPIIQAAIDAAAPPQRPGPDEPSYEWTDLGNGRRLAAFAHDRIRFTSDRGIWLVYDGNRWAADADAVLVEAVAKSMLRKWAGQLADRIATITKAIAEAVGKAEVESLQLQKKKVDEELNFAVKCQDVRRVRAMIAMARSEWPLLVPVFAEAFDSDPWLVNCANGTFDVRTGVFHNHDPEDLLTKLTPIRYDVHAEAPLYHRFLNQIFQQNSDLIAFIRRLSGMAATGDASDQALNIAWGQGANGKTTLLELWLHVLGEYAGKVPEELLIADKQNNRHPCEKVLLYGLRLAVASETGQDGRLDEARVKALTGGDTIMARGMGENFWSFLPRYTLFLLTNHQPTVRGTDHGIWRRLRLIPFVSRFWTEEDRTADPSGTYDPDQKADPTFGDRLKAEAEGILREMLDQATAYFAEGRTISVPACVTERTKTYRESEDVLGEFFTSRVRADRNTAAKPTERKRMKSSELYQAYKSWAEEAGYDTKGPNRILGVKAFTIEAKKRLESYTSNGFWFFAESMDCDSRPIDSEIDSQSESWRLGEEISNSSEMQKSTSIGTLLENGLQVSNTPDSAPIVFANHDGRSSW